LNPASPVALITGAARRVGAEIACALHAAGARVMLHYRTSATAAGELAAGLNALRADSAEVHGADLGDAVAMQALLEATLDRFGRLDALINNASTFYATPIGWIDEAAWTDLLGSNLKGPLFLSQAAVPALRETQGCIVNITDIHAERPLAGYAPYIAAKAGLLGLTRALAVELAPQVRVNAVAPGAIVWPDDGSFDPSAREAILRSVPLAREGTPDDIARTVKFLVFDAPYITGQVINVDGGRSTTLDHRALK
jgi:pteridine reductase